MQTVLITDLDGALLDDDYSYKVVENTIKALQKKEIPIIICTSKTRGEIELYRKELGIEHPFISENGGAIFIPKKYFDFDYKFNRNDGSYNIIELGTPYEMLVEIMDKIKKVYNVKCFHDMTTDELSKDAKLPLERAEHAKQREYDVAFKIIEPGVEDHIRQVINNAHLQFVKGTRYWHLMGNNDKGKAVKLLIELLRKKFGEIETIGIGASPNDFPMLDVVDRPYLVRLRESGTYASEKYIKAWGVGPEGWIYAVKEELGI